MIRLRIKEHCGGDGYIRAIVSARQFGARLFVVDYTRRMRPVRLLGSIDRKGRILEQSAMDLMQPERLVFGYERMMMPALALAAAPKSALLLGLGGGAMCRHLSAYVPGCALTVVERSAKVRDLARRYFHVDRPIVIADAAQYVARARDAFDVVLVDLYDGGGAARFGENFWRACLAVLKPGGCLAVNWAEFIGAETRRAEAMAVADAAGRSAFLLEHDPRPNVVQLAPTSRGFRLKSLPARFREFAHAHRLPRGDREVFQRCDVSAHYPVI